MEDHTVVDRPRKVVFVSNGGEQVDLCLKILSLQTQVLRGTWERLGRRGEEGWGDGESEEGVMYKAQCFINCSRCEDLSQHINTHVGGEGGVTP